MNGRNDFEWKVLARTEAIAVEQVEDELGPWPPNYEMFIASIGSRGWRMVQVVPDANELQFWFHRELPPIEMPAHDTDLPRRG
jgi:hypothetical protein